MRIKMTTSYVGMLLLLLAVQTASAFYDPGTQRWLNRDPIQERGGFNLFRYADNDPLWRIDPWGLDAGGRVGPGYPGDGYPHPPPVYDPNKWGDENCLSYARNRCGAGISYPDGNGTGDFSDCTSLKNDLKKTFRMDEPTNGKCDPGYHKIKVYAGFHVQRQDGDGKWSEKNYGFEPRRCKTNLLGSPIDSPQDGGKPAKSCGELCAPD